MVGVPVMLVSAKTAQITLPLLLVAALTGAGMREHITAARPPFGNATLCLAALLLFAVLSALWAPEPVASILIALMAVVIFAGSIVLAPLLRSEPRENALHMAEGLWIGLAIGVVYTLAEIASGQGIKIWVYNALQLTPDVLNPPRFFTWANGRVIAIHPDDLTRNVVPIPLLLWSALMATSTLPAHVWRPVITIGLTILSAAAVLFATSETSKLALIASMLMFLAAYRSTRLAQTALTVAWTVSCLAVVPLSMLTKHFELQNAPWLQMSAKLRITIWNEVALRVLEAPIFGRGADMTYFIRPPMREAPTMAPAWLNIPITHPHNIYLQVWYEFGAIGAALLTLFGVFLLRTIAALPEKQRAYGFATFAALAVQIAFSYNVWQIWFMCLFGFTLAVFAVGQGGMQPRKAQSAP